MANVTINNNREYLELRELCEGEYFLFGDELYFLAEGINDYCICFNLSDNEERVELDNETKVLRIPSEMVKIRVEI